ncbi:hypothetical protein [Fimbriiglobus ruber]|nr:hypothetical protein [Fimbriiglobus ruber]
MVGTTVTYCPLCGRADCVPPHSEAGIRSLHLVCRPRWFEEFQTLKTQAEQDARDRLELRRRPHNASDRRAFEKRVAKRRKAKGYK